MSEPLYIRYGGFRATESEREYSFQVTQGTKEPHKLTLSIANDAFLAHRLRYQDAPDVCSHRIQRELDALGDQPLASHLDVTTADLEAYTAAHAPQANTRRRRPAVPEEQAGEGDEPRSF